MPAQAGAGILDSSSRALLARGGGEGEGEGEELAVWVGALGATIVRSHDRSHRGRYSSEYNPKRSRDTWGEQDSILRYSPGGSFLLNLTSGTIHGSAPSSWPCLHGTKEVVKVIAYLSPGPWMRLGYIGHKPSMVATLQANLGRLQWRCISISP